MKAGSDLVGATPLFWNGVIKILKPSTYLKKSRPSLSDLILLSPFIFPGQRELPNSLESLEIKAK